MQWLFAPESGLQDRLLPRWLFLRALGLIYFSAFFPLVFQIKGLIGPRGILPADEYLQAVARALGHWRFWYAPTLLWMGSGNHALLALCWAGMIAAVLLTLNVWPRGMLTVCFACYLSFIAAAGDFSSYQSDGMLLEAGCLALLLAPPGFWPGLGAASPPSRASYYLLLWEWFRIYFESGLVKLLSGDPEWRDLTAMNDYYQNGPLPTWIGWYAGHLPVWFHKSTALMTLVLELGLVWLAVLPRRVRLVCFVLVTAWQIGVILTANYTFLNYLVLVLGFLLLDDRAMAWVRRRLSRRPEVPVHEPVESAAVDTAADAPNDMAVDMTNDAAIDVTNGGAARLDARRRRPILDSRPMQHVRALRRALAVVLLVSIGYVTTYLLLRMVWRDVPLPASPARALAPFRIANEYGLFAVMTRGRYEIEFQGSDDGVHWTAYPFRYKPQPLNVAPGLYAPYQPRLDWNLWFASLGQWMQYPIVPRTQELLLSNDPDVLALFAGNPFPNQPPRMVRSVLWQYWFTTEAEKRRTGDWWRRELLGEYAPTFVRGSDGQIRITQDETLVGPHE